jgi:predicted dehydrogenase
MQPATGDVYYMYSRRTNLGPIRNDVNAVWDLAPHDISIFNYFLDCVPEWVSVVGARVLKRSREDVAFIALGYPEGVIAHLHVSWADPNKVRETTVVSSNRRIVFDDLNSQEQVRVYEKGVASIVTHEASSYGEYQLQIRDGDILSPRIQISEPLKNLARHFIDCVLHGTRPLSDGVNGYDVVRVLEAIDRSLARNGEPVAVAPVSLQQVR